MRSKSKNMNDQTQIFGGHMDLTLAKNFSDAMSKQRTIYQFIIDRSGSMSDCITNTVTGFNEQVRRVKKIEQDFPEQEIVMGLTSFNQDTIHHLLLVPVGSMPVLTADMYRPDGMTAILDAIGLTVKKLEPEVNENTATTCVVVIITDGHENASKCYNLAEIKTLISRLEETGKWTFSFIGATLDAVDVAEQMNIRKHNSFSFAKENMDTAVWDKLSNSMCGYINKKHLYDTNLNKFIDE